MCISILKRTGLSVLPENKQIDTKNSHPIKEKIFLGLIGALAITSVAGAIFDYMHSQRCSFLTRIRAVSFIDVHCRKSFSLDQCIDKKENGFRFIDCIGLENPSYRFQYFPDQSYQEEKVVCTTVSIPFSYEEKHIYLNKFSQEEVKEAQKQRDEEMRERARKEQDHIDRFYN